MILDVRRWSRVVWDGGGGEGRGRKEARSECRQQREMEAGGWK